MNKGKRIGLISAIILLLLNTTVIGYTKAHNTEYSYVAENRDEDIPIVG